MDTWLRWDREVRKNAEREESMSLSTWRPRVGLRRAVPWSHGGRGWLERVRVGDSESLGWEWDGGVRR